MPGDTKDYLSNNIESGNASGLIKPPDKTTEPGKPKLFIGTDEVQIRKDHVISIYMATPDANGLCRIGFCTESPYSDYQRDHTEPMPEAAARALFAEFTKELNRAW